MACRFAALRPKEEEMVVHRVPLTLAPSCPFRMGYGYGPLEYYLTLRQLIVSCGVARLFLELGGDA